MSRRIFGIETEFGCLIKGDSFRTAEEASVRIKDYVFDELSLGIADMHYRDWGEPPFNGGFLYNGGRLYMDMGHLEYASPECVKLFDLVAYDRAIDFLVVKILNDLQVSEELSFIKNNVDHLTGATFGCHENYQLLRSVPFYKHVIPTLMPFFVTRQIYAGAGRVGGHDEVADINQVGHEASDFIGFQISQRADHIVAEVYEWIQFSRAIINTRDEPLADHNKYRRLHLLVGDSNMAEYTTALKVGATSLVLDFLEKGHRPPDLTLADPVKAIKEISRDQSFEWIVELKSGKTISAIDLQLEYLQVAQKCLSGDDEETDWVLTEWESVLEDLACNNHGNLVGRVDWVTKKWLLETFMEDENLDWDDPWVESLDLEYHNIHPETGLFYHLEDQGVAPRLTTDEQIWSAAEKPPQNTRAKARSSVMQYLGEYHLPCIVDWHQIYFTNDDPFELKDPFYTYDNEVEQLLKRLERIRSSERPQDSQ